MSDIVRRKRSDVIIELFNQKRLVVHSSLGGDGKSEQRNKTVGSRAELGATSVSEDDAKPP